LILIAENTGRKIMWDEKEQSWVVDDAANDDWIRAARLAKKADAGDEEARRELEKMENTKLITYDDED